MEIVKGNSFLLNGKFVGSKRIDSYIQPDTIQIYEVLRVSNSIPLFLGEHINRLKQSAVSIGKNFSEDRKVNLEKGVLDIIKKSKIHEGNIKIVLQYQNKENQVFIYFIPHSYPQMTDYENGVEVGLFDLVREDPNVKKINNIRDEINAYIAANNLYEVLLINHEEKITEGSRSNVFFIDSNDNILTAPDHVVLKGITRKYALQICDEKGFRVKFEVINKNEIGKYKTAFLSGTSPKILPIKKIENVIFDVNSSVLKAIMKSYDDILNKQ